MNSQQQQEAWFDAWLDAKLDGRPLPLLESGSMSDDDMQMIRSTIESASQLHAMATRADRGDRIPEEQDRVWNRVLDLVARKPRRLGSVSRFRPGWSAIVSTLVAAVVILAIVAGFRRYDFGNETGSGNVQFGSSGSNDISDTFAIPFGEGGCTAEPIERETLLGILAAEPMPRSPRSTTGVEFDEGTVSIQDVEYFGTLAESFYTCFYLGRPMSALQFATEEFIRDWVMSQVVFTYGVVTLDQTELYVDLLVERETSATRDGFLPIGKTVLTPIPRVTEWLETTDGRVHLTVDWVVQGVNEPGLNPANIPNAIVISRAESGVWGIDLLGSEVIDR